MTWMQYFSQRLQSEESQTDHWLVDLISNGSGDQVNIWPEERRCIIAAVTVLFFTETMTFVFLFFNMNDGCMLQNGFNTIFVNVLREKILWFLPPTCPCSLPSITYCIGDNVAISLCFLALWWMKWKSFTCKGRKH